MFRSFKASGVALLFLVIAGCGGGDQFLHVEGQVNMDGQPLSEGLVMLLPPENSTDLTTVSTQVVDGHFEIARSKKLKAGSYKVAITSEQKSGRQVQAEPGSSEKVEQYVQVIPPKYNSATVLSVDIAGDRDDLLFEVSRK